MRNCILRFCCYRLEFEEQTSSISVIYQLNNCRRLWLSRGEAGFVFPCKFFADISICIFVYLFFFLCVTDCLQMPLLALDLRFFLFCMLFFGVAAAADVDNLAICIAGNLVTTSGWLPLLEDEV